MARAPNGQESVFVILVLYADRANPICHYTYRCSAPRQQLAHRLVLLMQNSTVSVLAASPTTS